MDEAREEREELEALQADVDDLRREQEAEERFWVPSPPRSKNDTPIPERWSRG